MTGELETTDEPAGDAPRWDGWLAPRAWVPAGAILVVAVAVFAVLFVREFRSPQTITRRCEPGDPGCELRQKIHEHADFAVVIRGQQFDFGQKQFISTAEKELSPNVHIHSPRHTVIHIHREQTTWDEFFRSLGFELTDTCITLPAGERYCNTATEKLKFVVNGVRIDSIMFEDLQGLSRVLISYGPETDDQVMQQYAHVTDQACIPSGLCLARGTGSGEHGEPEPCTVSDNTCN